MPETQYIEGIDVTLGGSTTLSADVIDSDARIQISDISDFVGYLSYLDGVTYNVSDTSLCITQGRFWTKWSNKYGALPIKQDNSYLAPDWTKDWEIGSAFLFKESIPTTTTTALVGCATNYSNNTPTPIVYLNHSSYTHIYAQMFDSTSGNTFWSSGISLTGGLVADTWYFVKLSYNSSTKTMVLSVTTDFENWTTDPSPVVVDSVPYKNDDYMISFGSHNKSSAGNPAQNVILDLANTYIKQNDVIIWGHYDGAFAGENHYQNPAMPWRPLNDGYSNFWFELTDDTLSPWLNFSAKTNNAVIDWGDGSGEVALDTLTPTHTYSKAGRYVVKVKGVTGIARQVASSDSNPVYFPVLKAVELNSEITELSNDSFQQMIALEHIIYTNNIANIGQSCFRICVALKKITVPSISTINTAVFYYCLSLTEITIPSSVTAIAGSCFGYCVSLKYIHIEATTPPTIGANIFIGLPNDFVIYVPVGTGETYKAASGWSVYADHIVEEGSTLTRSQLRNIELENSKKSDDGDLR